MSCVWSGVTDCVFGVDCEMWCIWVWCGVVWVRWMESGTGRSSESWRERDAQTIVLGTTLTERTVTIRCISSSSDSGSSDGGNGSVSGGDGGGE